jgi:hypothetical protein
MSIRFFHGSMGTCGDIMTGLSSRTCHQFGRAVDNLSQNVQYPTSCTLA